MEAAFRAVLKGKRKASCHPSRKMKSKKLKKAPFQEYQTDNDSEVSKGYQEDHCETSTSNSAALYHCENESQDIIPSSQNIASTFESWLKQLKERNEKGKKETSGRENSKEVPVHENAAILHHLFNVEDTMNESQFKPGLMSTQKNSNVDTQSDPSPLNSGIVNDSNERNITDENRDNLEAIGSLDEQGNESGDMQDYGNSLHDLSESELSNSNVEEHEVSLESNDTSNSPEDMQDDNESSDLFDFQTTNDSRFFENSNDDDGNSDGNEAEEDNTSALSFTEKGQDFMAVCNDHQISHACKKDLWNWFMTNAKDIVDLQTLGVTEMSYKQIRTDHIARLPVPKMSYQIRDILTSETIMLHNLPSFPKKKYGDTGRYEVVYELAEVSLADVLNFHTESHGNEECRTICLSNDELPESKSGNCRLDVVSVRFEKCRLVYPLKVLRYKMGNGKEIRHRHSLLFQNIIEDIALNDLNLKFIIADAPKRAWLRGLATHGGYWSCDFCFAKGKHCRRAGTRIFKFDESKNAELRTHAKTMVILQKIESGEIQLRSNEAKGMKFKTIFTQLDNFDVIHHIPSDYMHFAVLGVVKEMVNLTFDFGSNVKNCQRLIQATIFNDEMLDTKTLSDFSRKVRPLFIGMKAIEYRNLALIYFPYVLENLPQTNYADKQMWACMVFVLRACVLPEDLYDFETNMDHVKRLNEKFLTLHEIVFGDIKSTYNYHQWYHMPDYRSLHGPLTEFSAFPFESSYAQLVNAFCAGTASTGKQILEGLFTKLTKKHDCERRIKFGKISTRSRDDLVYTKDFEFYRIIKSTDGTRDHQCVRLITQGYKAPGCDALHIPFEEVGVFEFIEEDESEECIINESQLWGKAVHVSNVLVAVPFNIARE